MSAPKRQRQRLAKAELRLKLAVAAHGWQQALLGQAFGLKPPQQWPADDPLVTLARTYDLSFAELARLCDQLGAEMEGAAIRAGYDEHWDEET